LMDGIVGMEGIGPNHGKPKKSNVVLASQDCIAIDAVGSTIMGYSPNEIPTLKIAQNRGLGTIDLNKITIKGERIDAVKTDFKKPVRIYKGLMFLPASVRNFFVQTPRLPFPNVEGCNKCGICEESCPVSAIKVIDTPAFQYEKCIRCYCCYELCPENGIKLKKSLFHRN
ncbi:MAG: 4Fe-4S binding protein, partial [Thermoplasmata archaeon]